LVLTNLSNANLDPDVPVGPVDALPVGPVLPVDVLPVGPISPVNESPVGPVSPVNESPVGPVFPIEKDPVGPVTFDAGHVSPFEPLGIPNSKTMEPFTL